MAKKDKVILETGDGFNVVQLKGKRNDVDYETSVREYDENLYGLATRLECPEIAAVDIEAEPELLARIAKVVRQANRQDATDAENAMARDGGIDKENCTKDELFDAITVAKAANKMTTASRLSLVAIERGFYSEV